MDGRLGIPPAPHSWPRLVRRRARVRGIVRGVDVDTSFFTGNYPSHCSIDALDTARAVGAALAAAEGPPWTSLLREVALTGNSHNYFAIRPETARRGRTCASTSFRTAASPASAPTATSSSTGPRAAGERRHDLASILNGGLVLGASDMHFGAKDNMIMPGRAMNMGDGWETRRRRGPGYDWAIVRLGAPGVISRVEIDTNHFKGNYPDSASIEACFAPDATLDELRDERVERAPPQTKLKAHHRHFFARSCCRRGRCRTCGSTSFPMAASAGFASMEPWQRLDLAAPDEARELLRRCCGASAWVERMVARRPFGARALVAPARDEWFGARAPTGSRRSVIIRRSATVKPLRQRFASTAHLSEREQRGVDGASRRPHRSSPKATANTSASSATSSSSARREVGRRDAAAAPRAAAERADARSGLPPRSRRRLRSCGCGVWGQTRAASYPTRVPTGAWTGDRGNLRRLRSQEGQEIRRNIWFPPDSWPACQVHRPSSHPSASESTRRLSNPQGPLPAGRRGAG